MKLKTISFAAMLLTLGVFVACSSDEEYIDNCSLIARTKAAPPDYFYNDPRDDAYHNFKKQENQCAVTALMMRGMELGKFSNYTGDAGQDRADELQRRILNTAYSDPTLNYNEESDSMSISTMMELGRRLGGEDHPYFSRYDDYSKKFPEAQKYLNGKKTRDSVSCVTLQSKYETKDHVVYVKDVFDNYFTYYGYNGEDNEGGKVYFNSTKKHKLEDEYWQITGFLIK